MNYDIQPLISYVNSLETKISNQERHYLRQNQFNIILNHGLYLLSKKVPYVFGGESEAGTDCSGFMQQIFGKAGFKLPRVSSEQIKTGINIPVGQEIAGELLGFDIGDRNGTGIEHIGMCLGNGLMIHTANNIDRICVVNYRTKYGTKLVAVSRQF